MPGLYCTDKCSCGGVCKFPSGHGYRIGRWQHKCSKCGGEWDVKIQPGKND